LGFRGLSGVAFPVLSRLVFPSLGTTLGARGDALRVFPTQQFSRGFMSTRTQDALNALAHVVVEHKGILKVLRERHAELAYRQALDKLLTAVDECEAAWAENERKQR
jgi:hypothetical protein